MNRRVIFGVVGTIFVVWALLLLVCATAHADPPTTSLVAFVQYAYEWHYRGATHQDSVRRVDPVVPLVQPWTPGDHRLDLGVINLSDITITSVSIHVELPEVPSAGGPVTARPDGHWRAQDARHYAYRIGDLPPGAGRWADGALFLRIPKPGQYVVRYQLLAPSRAPITGVMTLELTGRKP